MAENRKEDIREYFTKTLGQLRRHPDHGIRDSALHLNLEAGVISENTTLTELLEHPNESVKVEAESRLLREIEIYLHQDIRSIPSQELPWRHKQHR